MIHCDNQACIEMINSMRRKNVFLQACLRELWLILAVNNIMLKAAHIPGRENTLADCLSRWHTDAMYQSRFHPDHCTLHVHKTRTIQFRQRALEIVLPFIPHSVLCPVSALKRHLHYVIQDTEAPLFTIHTSTGLKPVTGHHFAKFIKSCIVSLGLDPTQCSPHSFRRGGATFAFNAGASPLFIKFLGDWSSHAYMVYLVLNTTQKLNVAKTLAQHIPATH